MKLATFSLSEGEPRVGAVDSDRGVVIDVQAVHVRQHGAPAAELVDMLAVIDAGQSGRGCSKRQSARHRPPKSSRSSRSDSCPRYRDRVVCATSCSSRSTC
ncbi:hypothetical protein [Aeromicrobium sp. UC242_57]|uniref:hypothetical protein n=1 Tax=Aeromicrobium sp. UC242_57 TaxID=3374624 RepID=UPI0037B7AD27